MKSLFAYIRVSTQKQGTQGSSLQEQRAAIEAYVKRNSLSIAAWFEESETAAKRGRPKFTRMMGALLRGEAQGVVIHKIDRSARNLRDWADLGDLLDRGVDVHFAHESLDMHSRGGRLAADIQAVVAADFIRNLRDEVKKGLYGRLKQGLYPLRAPLGYRDMGGGKAKEIDPVQGPLVRQAFELYGTGNYSYETLQTEIHKRGLRANSGKAISFATLTRVLNNPFYYGVICLVSSGQSFDGIHKPLIRKALFDRVQQVLRSNRLAGAAWTHEFLFRRLMRCANCDRALIGERQKKRYTYYRCHDPKCGRVCLSEKTVDLEVRRLLNRLRFDPEELRDMRDMLAVLRGYSADDGLKREAGLTLKLSQCSQRLVRLTDALLDGILDSESFEERKLQILNERRSIQDQIATLSSKPLTVDRVARYLELANTAYLQYETGFPEEKRQIVSEITSNFIGSGKYPTITLKIPFQLMLDYHNSDDGAPYRDDGRTLARQLFDTLVSIAANENGPLERPLSPPSPDVEKSVGTHGLDAAA
jgi:site-specific DNA recombinase